MLLRRLYHFIFLGIFLPATSLAETTNTYFVEAEGRCEMNFLFKPLNGMKEESSVLRRLSMKAPAEAAYFGLANQNQDQLIIQNGPLHAIDMLKTEGLESFKQAWGLNTRSLKALQASPSLDGRTINVVIEEIVEIPKDLSTMLDEGLIQLTLQTGFVQTRKRYSLLSFDLDGQLTRQIGLDKFFPEGYLRTNPDSVFFRGPLYVNGDSLFVSLKNEETDTFFRIDLSSENTPSGILSLADLHKLAFEEDPVRLVSTDSSRLVRDVLTLRVNGETVDVVTYESTGRTGAYSQSPVVIINSIGDERPLWGDSLNPEDTSSSMEQTLRASLRYQHAKTIRQNKKGNLLLIFPMLGVSSVDLQSGVLEIELGKGVVDAWLIDGMFGSNEENGIYTVGNQLFLYGSKAFAGGLDDIGDSQLMGISTGE